MTAGPAGPEREIHDDAVDFESKRHAEARRSLICAALLAARRLAAAGRRRAAARACRDNAFCAAARHASACGASPAIGVARVCAPASRARRQRERGHHAAPDRTNRSTPARDADRVNPDDDREHRDHDRRDVEQRDRHAIGNRRGDGLQLRIQPARILPFDAAGPGRE